MVINELLDICDNGEGSILSFADYVLIILNAKPSYHFKGLSKVILKIAEDWAMKFEPEFYFNKCKYLMINRSTAITHTPKIILCNNNIKYTKELKYLI